jgi:hypothetical protein
MDELAYLEKEGTTDWGVQRRPANWGETSAEWGPWEPAEFGLATILGDFSLPSVINRKFAFDYTHVNIRRKLNPFAVGGVRLATYMEVEREGTDKKEQWVLKEFKRGRHGKTDITARNELSLALICSHLATEFNKLVPSGGKKITFLQVVVVRIAGRYYNAEPNLEGEYRKFNSNNGYIGDETSFTAQAFSHWTHHHTGGDLIVVDLQGQKSSTGYTLTDPAIHSSTYPDEFGNLNNEKSGYEKFFTSHQCNAICTHLGLPRHPLQTAETSTLSE